MINKIFRLVVILINEACFETKMSTKNFTIILMCLGFLFIGTNGLLPNSTTIDYVNKLCFGENQNTEEINDREMKILHDCCKDLPSGLAIRAYLEEFRLENRINSRVSSCKQLYTDANISALFMSTLRSSENGKDFFQNQTVTEIQWYGIVETYLRRTVKSAIQRQLNGVFAEIYYNLNISEVLNQFSTRNNSENVTKNEIIRELSVLEAILTAMIIRKDLQNPILHKIAFFIYQFEEFNQLIWKDKLIENYLEELVNHIPECLKLVMFSNTKKILLLNKYYQYPFSRHCSAFSWDSDGSMWKNVK